MSKADPTPHRTHPAQPSCALSLTCWLPAQQPLTWLCFCRAHWPHTGPCPAHRLPGDRAPPEQAGAAPSSSASPGRHRAAESRGGRSRHPGRTEGGLPARCTLPVPLKASSPPSCAHPNTSLELPPGSAATHCSESGIAHTGSHGRSRHQLPIPGGGPDPHGATLGLLPQSPFLEQSWLAHLWGFSWAWV